jgi:hypothetical protein
VYGLAAARLARLLVEDKITEKPRNALTEWLKARQWWMLWYLSTCTWCTSVWVGLSMAIVYRLWGTNPWVFVPALGLAFSYVAGWLSSHEGRS